MGDNYLVINGQRIEFTEEQKKQLGIVEEKKSRFGRVRFGENYCWIDCYGLIEWNTELNDSMDASHYATANYCTDEELMNQRALHETLNRLLWRYSMTHDGDKIDWSNNEIKWKICYDTIDKHYEVDNNAAWKIDGVVYFYTKDIALKAIEEIVKPFIKKHPEFVW